MSGELAPILNLKVGDEVIVYDPNPNRHAEWTEKVAKVAKVARVWIVTEKGRRFRLDRQNEGHDFGLGGYHFKTAEQDAYRRRVAAAWEVLNANGLRGSYYSNGSKDLHDAKLFAIAELLEPTPEPERGEHDAECDEGCADWDAHDLAFSDGCP